ncbi:hypothetical protein ACIRRA_43980 [Nocardia sp. NPDC101769]|uniref:hypothetical protein n=1 Tax=Nocardia sp. NPDC101769 TaxID=3364333 RepID=UPI00381792DF
MSEDPETAQARIFLTELEKHAQIVARRRAAAAAGSNDALNAELSHIRRQIDKIWRRFPQLRPEP